MNRYFSVFAVLSLGAALLACQPEERPVVSRDQAAGRSVAFQLQSFAAPPRSVQDVLARFDVATRPAAEATPTVDDDDAGAGDGLGMGPARGGSWREIADSQPGPGLNDRQLATFLARRAQAAQRIGRIPAMLEDSRRAAALAKSSEHPNAGSIFQTLALREWNYGRIDAAFAAIDEGLTVSLQPGPMLALHRERISFHGQLGRRQQAAQALAQMTPVAEAALRGSGPYIDLYRLRYDAARGNVANVSGRYRDSEPLWRSAAAAAKRMQEKAEAGQLPNAPAGVAAVYALEYTRALGALAHVQTRLGRLVEAESTEREALAESLRAFGPYASQSVNRLISFGQIVMAQGRFAEGEQVFRTVLRVLDRNMIAANADIRLQASTELANALALNRDYAGARRVYDGLEASLANQQAQQLRYLTRNPLHGLTLIETGAAARAATQLTTALEARSAVSGATSRNASVVRALRGEAYARTGDPARAAADFAAALPVLRAPIAGVGEEEVTLNERMRRTALGYAIDFLAPRGEAQSAQALVAADSLGSLGLQAAIRSLALRGGDLDEATRDLLREQQDLALEIGVLERHLVDAQSRRADAGSMRALQDEIAALRQRNAGLRSQIVRRSPELQRLERNAGLDVQRLTAALRPREVALAIYSGERSTHVWAITREGIAGHHEAPLGKAAIAAQVAQLRRALDVDGSVSTLRDLRPYDVAAAHRLYASLIEPLRARWGDAETMVAAVSGPLASLPLGALVTKPGRLPAAAPGQAFFAEYRAVPFLAREMAIAHVPSLSGLVALRELRAAPAGRRPFLAFADPVFGSAASAPAAGDGAMVRRAVFRSGARASATIADLPPLPDTAEEARAIAQVLGGSPESDLFLGAKASERALRGLDTRNWRVVMFATHGLLAGDVDGLLEPALALSPGDAAGGDGLLTVGKIMTLRLDADWVVLSACNTAGPQGEGAEALSGVSRAFLYAGARSLLVTHWPVETTAARSFTVELFRRQAAGDASRGAAMRAVSEAMIAELGAVDRTSGRMLFSYAHPLFWAPFAFVGDPG